MVLNNNGKQENVCNLNFEIFPFTSHLIQFENPDMELAVYRCSTNNPMNGTKPRFFGSQTTAAMYARQYKNTQWQCILRKNIVLIDLRFLKYLLLEVLLNNTSKPTIEQYATSIKTFLTVTGLVSHVEQYINLCDLSHANVVRPICNRPTPLEDFGSRLSIGPLDDTFVEFVSTVFPTIDGYIAPQLPQYYNMPGKPFHAEICLFNPSKCIVASSQVAPETESTLPIVSLHNMLLSDAKNIQSGLLNNLMHISLVHIQCKYAQAKVSESNVKDQNTNVVRQMIDNNIPSNIIDRMHINSGGKPRKYIGNNKQKTCHRLKKGDGQKKQVLSKH